MRASASVESPAATAPGGPRVVTRPGRARTRPTHPRGRARCRRDDCVHEGGARRRPGVGQAPPRHDRPAPDPPRRGQRRGRLRSQWRRDIRGARAECVAQHPQHTPISLRLSIHLPRRRRGWVESPVCVLGSSAPPTAQKGRVEVSKGRTTLSAWVSRTGLGEVALLAIGTEGGGL